MRRNWTALAPCPVAKELIPVHPRKVFYYLTTCPRQELPASATDILPTIVGGGGKGKGGAKRIISPSLSNASQDDDDPSVVEDRKRAALSPSPEIDLSIDLDEMVDSTSAGSSPDFPTPAVQAGSPFDSVGASLSRQNSNASRDLDLNRRAQSPRLEGDEREFTATARGLRLRGMSMEGLKNNIQDMTKLQPVAKSEADATLSEEEKAKRNSEAAATLFGSQHDAHEASVSDGAMILSSPFSKPMAAPLIIRDGNAEVRFKRESEEDVDMEIDGIENFDEWDARGPENIELDELDDLLEEYEGYKQALKVF